MSSHFSSDNPSTKALNPFTIQANIQKPEPHSKCNLLSILDIHLSAAEEGQLSCLGILHRPDQHASSAFDLIDVEFIILLIQHEILSNRSALERSSVLHCANCPLLSFSFPDIIVCPLPVEDGPTETTALQL